MTIHIVQSGETLYSVAREYGVNPDVLAVNNGISAPERLAEGQSLIIVFPKTLYTVRRGDTLYSVAARFGVSLNTLYRNNLVLEGKPYIFEGQELVIEIYTDPVGRFMTGGYAYPFIDGALLDSSLPAMSGIMPFTYGLKSDGSGVVMLDDSRIIAQAKLYGTKPVMHLSTLAENGTFSVPNAEALLQSPEKWAPLVSQLLSIMAEKDYYGLDVDFEFLGADNASRYAEFITFVREVLNSNGYPLLVALSPKVRDDQPGVLYEGHDYAALGEAANSVLLMTYEWGYTYGPPMAVSPIQPVRRVIEYALTRIPATKIFLGISNYGYDFTLPYVQGLSKARSISTVEATRLAGEYRVEINYDPVSKAPFFNYTDAEGRAHVVWYEDGRSIYERLKLINEYSLKGALYWNLMRPNPQNLTVLAAAAELLPLDLF